MMREPLAVHPIVASIHGAWSELSLLSVTLSRILAATWRPSSPPAGWDVPAGDDWLQAYA